MKPNIHDSNGKASTPTNFTSEPVLKTQFSKFAPVCDVCYKVEMPQKPTKVVIVLNFPVL